MQAQTRIRLYQAANLLFFLALILTIDIPFASRHLAHPEPHPQPTPIPIPGPSDPDHPVGPQPPPFQPALFGRKHHHHDEHEPEHVPSEHAVVDAENATIPDLPGNGTHPQPPHHGKKKHHHHHHGKKHGMHGRPDVYHLFSLLHPAAFWMTPIVHALAAVPLALQFTHTGTRYLDEVVQWRWLAIAASSLLSYSFYTSFHPILSFLVSLWILAASSELLFRLHLTESGRPTKLAHLPLYLAASFTQAWSLVIVFWNAWDAVPHHADALFTRLSFVTILFVLLLASIAYASATVRGEIPGSLAIAYALVFVAYQHRTAPFYFISATIAAVFSLFPIAKSAYSTYLDLRQTAIHLPDDEDNVA